MPIYSHRSNHTPINEQSGVLLATPCLPYHRQTPNRLLLRVVLELPNALLNRLELLLQDLGVQDQVFAGDVFTLFFEGQCLFLECWNPFELLEDQNLISEKDAFYLLLGLLYFRICPLHAVHELLQYDDILLVEDVQIPHDLPFLVRQVVPEDLELLRNEALFAGVSFHCFFDRPLEAILILIHAVLSRPNLAHHVDEV